MAETKGASFEDLVREYFLQNEHFSVRSIPFSSDGGEVTDIDVWAYAKSGRIGRIQSIVDVKNKKSPKALERVAWVKGLAKILEADQAFVVTTDNAAMVADYARRHNVTIITKTFLEAQPLETLNSRISLEEMHRRIAESAKDVGISVREMRSAIGSIVKSPPFSAFNHCLGLAAHAARRIPTLAADSSASDIAVRLMLMFASLACICLDRAVFRFQFDPEPIRRAKIAEGVSFGGDGLDNSRMYIRRLVDVIEGHMENGPLTARKVQKTFDSIFHTEKSEQIAEFFAKQFVIDQLFASAIDMEKAAFSSEESITISTPSKSILSAFLDFFGVDRASILDRIV